MWYTDEILSNPNLSASLYLNPGADDTRTGHQFLTSGWVADPDTTITITHSWGDASNPITKISDMIASSLNGGVSLLTMGMQNAGQLATTKAGGTVLNWAKSHLSDEAEAAISKITNAISTQAAFVGASSFLKQYSGSDADIPNLEFTAVFINSDYNNPIGPDTASFKNLLVSILPKEFKIEANLIAIMTAPNGYKLPIDTSDPNGELRGSFVIAIKGQDNGKMEYSSQLTGGLGAEGGDFHPWMPRPKSTKSSLKLISNLLLTEASVSRSSNLVITSQGLKPSYYSVKMTFTYGRPLVNESFINLL